LVVGIDQEHVTAGGSADDRQIGGHSGFARAAFDPAGEHDHLGSPCARLASEAYQIDIKLLLC
jgi:hypothetical protein